MNRQVKYLHLLRIAGNAHGTFGVLLDVSDGPLAAEPFAVTLEDAWRDNQRNVSCIPAGGYRCTRVDSPAFGDTFTVCNVPNRSLIRFHKGNTHEDTHGCILVAEQFERIDGTPGVAASGAGFREFLTRLRTVDSFDLTVIALPGYGRTG